MSAAPISISALSSAIKQVLQRSIPPKVWLWGEVNSLMVRGGHCYVDLVEKAAGSDAMVARIRCNIWQWNWRTISEKFRQATGEELRVGMTVQLLVQVDYHELYSLSVNASDIDPTYTLGELQRRRLEIIARLKQRGLLMLNKQRVMPLLIKRIAIVSSPHAAGYSDFLHQLNGNPHGFTYRLTLFPAVMQGVQTEQSVTAALQSIAANAGEFDIAVIIRGGGATSDMYAFDSEQIATVCASMPLPVLSGIGHHRDECILDLVTHTALKTPTAVADFIITHTLRTAERIDAIGRRMQQSVTARLNIAGNVLKTYGLRLPSATALLVQGERHLLANCAMRLRVSSLSLVADHRLMVERRRLQLNASTRQLLHLERNGLERRIHTIIPAAKALIQERKNRIELTSAKLAILDPRRLLARGYSITSHQGRVITDPSVLSPGDTITTTFANGSIESTVDTQVYSKHS